MEPPPVRTIRNWKARFLETLSILPRSHAGNQTRRKISEERKFELVGAFGDGSCSSQRQASARFNISLGAVNKILKEKGMKSFKYTKVQELK